jgi:hypothetical protein
MDQCLRRSKSLLVDLEKFSSVPPYEPTTDASSPAPGAPTYRSGLEASYGGRPTVSFSFRRPAPPVKGSRRATDRRRGTQPGSTNPGFTAVAGTGCDQIMRKAL